MDLDDYNSEEDEDYVASGGESDDYDESEFGGPSVGGAAGGKKRKKGGKGVLARPGVEWKPTKKARQGGVGAAVISDDEDDFMERPIAQPTRPVQQQQPAQTPAAPAHAATAASSTAAAASTAAQAPAANATAEPAAQPTVPAAAPDAAATAASEATANGSAASAPAAAAASAASSSSAAALPTADAPKPTLQQLLAQFNKPKTAAAPPPPRPAAAAPSAAPAPAAAKSATSSRLAALLAKTNPTPSVVAMTSGGSPAAATASANAANLSDEKIVVKELTSYAGESIEITRTIVRGSAADKGRHKGDNLAALVASLSAKRGMSTLDKSRVDWDMSKAEEGDSAELEAAAKSGYVDKMAFLAKTDARQFEIEKAARDVKRREAAKAAASKGAPTPSERPQEYDAGDVDVHISAPEESKHTSTE